MSFMQRLKTQAQLTPTAIAVRSQADVLTYAELDRRSTALARCLVARGVKPEEAVGVALPRSIDLLVGIIGVLKSGAVYLPLDVKYPRARLHYGLDDAGASVVLTTGESE